jgi:hypothetical protein
MSQPTRLCRGRPGKALDSLVVLAMEKVQWHAWRCTCGPNGERRRSLERCTAGFRSPQCPLWVNRDRCGRSHARMYVRCCPKADKYRIVSVCPLSAITGREQMQQPNVPMHGYSITSSAPASSVGGKSRPSPFAVLRLITSSYLVGACTGRSVGFSPLRMRST